MQEAQVVSGRHRCSVARSRPSAAANTAWSKGNCQGSYHAKRSGRCVGVGSPGLLQGLLREPLPRTTLWSEALAERQCATWRDYTIAGRRGVLLHGDTEGLLRKHHQFGGVGSSYS
ncbi:hypothetical protein J6590_005051 [Homalodisca vitripennis]|nr:hypothetical protein J6590_005051 [Homalodisca vitripennis]